MRIDKAFDRPPIGSGTSGSASVRSDHWRIIARFAALGMLLAGYIVPAKADVVGSTASHTTQQCSLPGAAPGVPCGARHVEGIDNSARAAIKPNATASPPPQAVAAGYTTPVLIDDFSSDSVSPDGSGSYNWYPVDGLSAYSIGGDTLTIASDTSGYGAGLISLTSNGPALSTPGAIASNQGNGVAYRYGYFEASLSFDPEGFDYTGAIAAGQSDGGDWPAFWLAHGPDGPTNPSGDFNEIDIFEGIPADRFSGHRPRNGSPAQNSATLHEWTQDYVNVAAYAFPVARVNFSQPAVFGCLWTPTAISIYLNNVLQSTVAIGPGTPYPSAAIDYDSIILGTGYNWPVVFNYVHVWQ